jgi:hypothetical protein
LEPGFGIEFAVTDSSSTKGILLGLAGFHESVCETPFGTGIGAFGTQPRINIANKKNE